MKPAAGTRWHWAGPVLLASLLAAAWLLLEWQRVAGGGHALHSVAALGHLAGHQGLSMAAVSAFIAAAVAMMAPCLLQMALVLTAVLTGLSPQELAHGGAGAGWRGLAPVGRFLLG